MHKKFPLFFILASSFASSLSLHAQGQQVHQNPALQPFQPFTGKVLGSKVRLRTQPSRESPVVRELGQGEMVGIVAENNDYYVVRAPKGMKGYVFRTYILDNVVTGEKVNVRLQPDTEAAILGRLHDGEKVLGEISSTNNKWLEIALPESTRFYIAKEYVENVGSFEMLAEMEARYDEAMHKLNSIFHFARAELQKSFEEVSFETIHQKFEALCSEFADISELVQKAKDANALIEETYLQKKISFLESKNDRSMATRDLDAEQIQRLSLMSRELKQKAGDSSSLAEIGNAAVAVMGQSPVANDPVISEKNSQWQSLEESLFHLWAVANDGKTMEDFYEESAREAIFLTGVIESYTRPVKNRPGDYLIRNENAQPLAFLYSTKVNLQDLIGKKVTIVSTPRPNNNFAFPAYFVLGVE